MEFDNSADVELSQFGEFGLIKHLTEQIELVQDSSMKGVGDDAAVIDNKDLLTVVILICSPKACTLTKVTCP